MKSRLFSRSVITLIVLAFFVPAAYAENDRFREVRKKGKIVIGVKPDYKPVVSVIRVVS